jgi:hypothetical protein
LWFGNLQLLSLFCFFYIDANFKETGLPWYQHGRLRNDHRNLIRFSRDLAGVHFTGSTGYCDIWASGTNIINKTCVGGKQVVRFYHCTICKFKAEVSTEHRSLVLLNTKM